MLICLYCQFENPDHNKFCQNCGNSLTEKYCPECHTKIPLNIKECHNCGTPTGQIWLAVLYSTANLPLTQVDQPELPISQIDYSDLPPNYQLPITNNQLPNFETSVEPSSDIIRHQLDPAFESPETENFNSQSLPNDTITNEDIEDTAALNIPGAAAFTTDENAELSDKIEEKTATTPSIPVPTVPSPPSSPIISLTAGTYLDSQKRYQLLDSLVLTNPLYTATALVLDCNPLQTSLLRALSTAKSEIPAIAKPYITLKLEFPQNLPNLHDVLEENGQAAIILEDCSNWPLLSDCWKDPKTSIQQILYWLNEMTELWVFLETYQSRQSLLEITNLRVNPDPIGPAASIRLQSLYAESIPSDLNLQSLGEFWLTLFNQSDSTQLTALTTLLRDLILGNIQTIESLRSHLENIHNSLEPDLISTSAISNLQLDRFQQQFPDIDEETATLPLPMQVYCLEDSGRTDVGRQRQHNEDFFSIWTQTNKLETCLGRIFHVKGLYILCDGMGGHDSGEVASQLAVESLKQYFHEHWGEQLPSAEIIREGVLLANQAIYEINQIDARSGSGRMGTTLVVVLIQNSQVAVAHVGDSRLYRLRRGWVLEKITNDHEVGQREINRGIDPAIAYSRPDAYQLTQALGPRDEEFVKPEVQFLELTEDTLLILASDGLTDNNLLETYGQSKLEPLFSSQSNLEQGVKNLIDLANEYNGHDNITAILIRAKVKPYR
jgi:protein phosphatase